MSGEEKRQCDDDDDGDGADYEWSVNVSSTESEDDPALNGLSATFLITYDTGPDSQTMS